jgi:hypothetical protein
MFQPSTPARESAVLQCAPPNRRNAHKCPSGATFGLLAIQ